MKAIVIGAYGHIGSYLVPKLIRAGYEVIAISRGKSKPYTEDILWKQVTHITMDRSKEPNFPEKIAALKGDIVIDLINFTVEDTRLMVAALKETDISHYLYCSSIWAHGRATILPTDPNSKKYPLDEYGIQKYESEKLLKNEYYTNGFPATIIMPGQISGPKWTIINPLANHDPEIFQKIANGEVIYLPNFGMETLHHVHASDVAQIFVDAIKHRESALGESFHAVAEDSLTLFGYAQATYHYFKKEPKIKFLSWEKWCEFINNEDYIDKTYFHIARSGKYSIENAKDRINYSPEYSTLEVIEESLKSYIDNEWISVKN
ncbi:NAD-dependent epimerase/dehydratase family protein [Candidatus Enterococcus lemimoniae]|uniref:NAD-dependent epimerase/dehydratase domain-containing protein n=1 Tax=Candidatus Enterococcus lemimoniae TaxID=1834167 RepID=A0ABZ2T8J0_9ENTE|nr:NAD-dependent epimerase/dehydratase family protein [Enterococcus sp. 12C11_DIV0727]OTO68645.1 hypothetical protein A5866_000843 [Enterococcus sp. 12C11_DIV0727]